MDHRFELLFLQNLQFIHCKILLIFQNFLFFCTLVFLGCSVFYYFQRAVIFLNACFFLNIGRLDNIFSKPDLSKFFCFFIKQLFRILTVVNWKFDSVLKIGDSEQNKFVILSFSKTQICLVHVQAGSDIFHVLASSLFEELHS